MAKETFSSLDAPNYHLLGLQFKFVAGFLNKKPLIKRSHFSDIT